MTRCSKWSARTSKSFSSRPREPLCSTGRTRSGQLANPDSQIPRWSTTGRHCRSWKGPERLHPGRSAWHDRHLDRPAEGQVPPAATRCRFAAVECLRRAYDGRHGREGSWERRDQRTECDHLAFRAKETDWQIWIAQGQNPYPCRYVITSKGVDQAPQFTLEIRDWKAGAGTRHPISASSRPQEPSAWMRRISRP